MARINPLHLPRPVRQVFHREIVDGDQTSDFWLRALDTTQQFAALGVAKDKVRLYITGDDKTPAYPFPPVGGEAVEGLTADMMETVAFVYAMQSDVTATGSPVPDVPYTFEEMVALSLTRPRMWGAVIDLVKEVTKSNASNRGNASREVGVLTSDSPSNTLTSTTKLRSGKTRSS
jgi:hypothetical protein